MIIKETKLAEPINYIGGMPDQFVSEKIKSSEEWVKSNMDFFYNEALVQLRSNIKNFKHNYELINGHLDTSDFYQNQEVSDFISPLNSSYTEMMKEEYELPSYVQHYDIMSRPLNTLKGELSKRPDFSKVVAMDVDSINEKKEVFNNLLLELILNNVRQSLIVRGITPEENEEEFEKITQEEAKKKIASFTTQGEKFGNAILNSCKVEFNLKELSEEGFQDLNVSAREFFHVFPVKSSTGFTVENLNPVQVGYKATQGKKYTKDAYAAWVIDVMEISEIIDKFELTKEEIDHLRETNKEYSEHGNYTRSNLLGTNKTGESSTFTDTYNPYIEDIYRLNEFHLQGRELDAITDGMPPSGTGYWGNKYVVIVTYWCSKKKIGLLKYLDENGEEQSQFVDENYKHIPEEISIEWQWTNQWWRGVKIGDVYLTEPLEYLNYCPIIGVVHNTKNSRPTSKVDRMKKFQAIFNVAINQAWKILEKDKGIQYEHELKTIPTSKDGDDQDALEMMETIMDEKGIILKDTSPENVRGSLPNTATSKVVDLTRDRELKMRIELAQWAKGMCWEMVGMSEQRMGNISATETAYGTQSALTQSYAQTEPDFAQHEYLLNQLFQAIIDISQYFYSKKESSSITWVGQGGDAEFLTIMGDELTLPDLKVFVTNRQKEHQLLNDLKGLSQHMIQNGADEYSIAELYSTESIRELKDSFKKLREKREEIQQQNQQIEQQKIEQAQQAQQALLEQQERHHKENLQMEKYKIDVQAQTRISEAQIKNYFQEPDIDANDNNVPDPQDIADLALKRQALISKDVIENLKLKEVKEKRLKDNSLKERELDIKEKDIESRERIAKVNKNKYDSKK